MENSNNTPTESETFVCGCHSLEHMIILEYDKQDKDLSLFVHLIHRGFWSRVKYGIKYIFGYKSRYGEWDNVIIKPEDYDRLISIIQEAKQQR